MTMETNNPNTILLLESGDLEVYDGKRPEQLQDEYNLPYCKRVKKWLSTKRIVKMAEGERPKLSRYIFVTGMWNDKRSFPIDVSDIVEIREEQGKYFPVFWGYFKEPVREVESQMDLLVDLLDMRNEERSFTYILQHFTINRK